MGNLARGKTFGATETVTATSLHTLVDGGSVSNITNDDIKSTAAIVDTKLAQITTASKVSGAAITNLANIPSGAGAIPSVNIDSGTTANKVVKLDDNAKIPAVDGSQLTNTPQNIIQIVNTQSGAVATGTTQIPYDDTIPQNTEGDEYMTLAITPNSATNKLLIEVVIGCMASSGGTTTVTVALFQDTTANALACAIQIPTVANYPRSMVLRHYMAAGTTSETTFKVRMGGSEAGTTTFNGVGGVRKFGGVVASSITITEIKV